MTYCLSSNSVSFHVSGLSVSACYSSLSLSASQYCFSLSVCLSVCPSSCVFAPIPLPSFLHSSTFLYLYFSLIFPPMSRPVFSIDHSVSIPLLHQNKNDSLGLVLQARLAAMYLPIIGITLETFEQLYDPSVEGKKMTPGIFDEEGDRISQRVAMAIAGSSVGGRGMHLPHMSSDEISARVG